MALQRLKCEYCGSECTTDSVKCHSCGAPLKIKDAIIDESELKYQYTKRLFIKDAIGESKEFEEQQERNRQLINGIHQQMINQVEEEHEYTVSKLNIIGWGLLAIFGIGMFGLILLKIYG